MRRGIVFLFAFLFVLGGVASAFAVTADTTHKGSLLIYPKIDVTSTPSYTDTYIFLSNDGPSPVSIECYWVRGDTQDITDFEFTLTGYQEYNFDALYGGFNGSVEVPGWPFPYPKGFLACFAVSGATAANWNYLYGSAWVIDYAHDVAYSYPAWSFRALNAPTGAVPTPITTLPIPPGGTSASLSLPLDGVTYNSCPAQLAFNFPLEYTVAGFPFAGFNDLTILPCNQDLRENHGEVSTKLKFDVWNTFETKFTNAYSCSSCWWDKFLTDPSIHYVSAFSCAQENSGISGLFAAFGRFRVTGISDPSSCPGSVATGIIGELVSYIPTWPVFAFSNSGIAPSADGPAGYIFYDVAGQDMPGVKHRK